MVVWLYMDGLDVMAGGPLAIERLSDATFDAIVFGEREPHRWMAGSGWFDRTQDFDPGFEEKNSTLGKLIQIAISYEDGGETHIIGYRNGEVIGDYTFGALEPYATGDVKALFGVRAYIDGIPYGWIDARVEDARIYGAVLSQDDIKGLIPNTTPVEAGGKLATAWGTVKRSF